MKIDESWAAARFDSLPHVVQLLTSKDREGDIQLLKERGDVIEEVVDEVVHAYHSGFNKAIQNYSQVRAPIKSSSSSSLANVIGYCYVDITVLQRIITEYFLLEDAVG